MRSYDCSRAFSVDVEIPHVEFALGKLDLFRRAGVHRPGEAEFRVIGDFKSVLEISRLDYCQHGAKNFFLFELGFRLNVGHYRGLDEIAVSGIACALAAGDQASFALADLDV